MSLTVHQVAIGGLDDNFAYVIADTNTNEAFVVDPSGDFLKVSTLIDTRAYTIVGILLTHTHHDHYDKLTVALEQYPVPTYVYQTSVHEIAAYGETRALTDNMELLLGNGAVRVLHTPGHIDDAVCFYIRAEAAHDTIPKVITGDTLFVGGCGRTNELRVKDLYESLAELANLPDETVVFPGHNYGNTPTSTLGNEKATNRFYLAENFNEFVKLRLG